MRAGECDIIHDKTGKMWHKYDYKIIPKFKFGGYREFGIRVFGIVNLYHVFPDFM